ncbi:hypothetical protein RHSIM_Rhsim13G0180900 [Rhododendron simsii]|uniref:Trans-resveratrol di-O-methyltransferase n=1 Tax=Rhododendron simsii TaxID=118357 RepID=A0A834L3G9_RHOSS|nr:hypothetical protein RHSIM_Rhsim13G0180900 [Rhododendron simsii]
MDHQDGQLGAKELFQAQSHIYKHAFSFANSMCLSGAIQLGIPDIIHNHKQPITLPELVSSLHLPPEKTNSIYRLLRLLVHLGFFAIAKANTNEGDQEGYVLTPSSRLLLKSEIANLSPFARAMVDPVLVTPWQFLGDWFQGNETTAFETAHGVGMWEFCDQNPKFNHTFNEAMASDSKMMNFVVGECKAVFEGLSSLVDVGGGTGLIAWIILDAYPHIKCTVFDLPHVIANLPESKNLSYVGGDMFESIPSADAILFKCVLHNWSDEDCVKILKRCKEAIPSKGDGGKVIIIDMVIDGERDEHDIAETKLVFDILMMVLVTGRERTEKEWEHIFLQAGFSHYKITPIFGLRSLIEVYP